MKEVSFRAYGHPNISAAHSTTFEFTKDDFVTERGDCILGIRSDFCITEDFLKIKKVRIEIEAAGITETVHAEINPGFSSDREMVVRRSDFLSERTFAVNADKACSDFSEEFRKKLKHKDSVVHITLKNEEKTA